LEIIREASELIIKIKENRPVIHHITNYVTMNDSANVVLAIGGSPIMANDPGEVIEVAAMAKALVLNMGTPNNNNLQSMLLAGKKAKEMKIPVVFDPVGAGATSFRREMCCRLIEDIKPDVIKGNLSEIMYMSNIGGFSCGIDSFADVDNGTEIVKKLAGNLNCVVAATGRRDIISNGSTTYIINNGHEMLSRITGTGCMTASLVGAFCSATENCLTGALGGIMAMGVAGQLAFDSLQPNEGTGMFKVRLFDNIYNLNREVFVREGAANEE
jgi:hydroxyethylthiazole kinase